MSGGRWGAGAWFTLSLWAVAAGACALTLALSPASQRVPGVVVGLTAALLTVQLGLDVFPRRRPRDASAITPNGTDAPRQRRVLLWLAGLLLALHLVGYWAAVPAFLALYLRVQAGERWRWALGLAALFAAGVYALSHALGTRMPAGVWGAWWAQLGR